MLIKRLKVIALCAGGWVSVMGAVCFSGELHLPTHCRTEPTNATWVNRVGSIVVNITDPKWCPVIIDGPPGTRAFQNYSANVQINAAAVSPSTPRMDYTFANANNVVQRMEMKFLTIGSTIAVTTATGAYEAGTAGNVAIKRDFVHNTIYTTSGPATGDGWLDYAYRVNPAMSGVTSQANGHIMMTANTPLVQQPVTYQWWINGVLQGPPTTSPDYFQKYGKVVTKVGPYLFKAVVIDRHNTSYTVTRTVTVTAVCAVGRKC